MTLQTVLGIYDLIAACLLLWANQKITVAAGFKGKTAQWALLRRVAYLAASFSLFALGVQQLFHIHYQAATDAAHIILVTYVLMFPWLRAKGWITQDMLSIDGDR